MNDPAELYIVFEKGLWVGVFKSEEAAQRLCDVREKRKPYTVKYVPRCESDDVLKVARVFTDDSECLDPQCVNKVCVLNKAFTKLDRELEK